MEPCPDSKASVSDAELVKMAFSDEQPLMPNNSVPMQKTTRGFLKGVQKNSNMKHLVGKKAVPVVKKDEYTFFKKKVRLNVVEKKVHKFQLD